MALSHHGVEHETGTLTSLWGYTYRWSPQV